jgi:hypothetical protein
MVAGQGSKSAGKIRERPKLTQNKLISKMADIQDIHLGV